jgi:hypothetical protein
MKITRKQLRQIIKEELTMVIPKTDKQSGEGSMARGQLSRTGQIAAMLLQMIHDDTDLPEWVESKITLSQDYLSTVLDYLKGKESS